MNGQPGNKRPSFNHYMVESSITEEIKEENSDKSGSDSANQSNGITTKIAHIHQSKMFTHTHGDTSTKNRGTQNSSSNQSSNEGSRRAMGSSEVVQRVNA